MNTIRISDLLKKKAEPCPCCGKVHLPGVDDVCIESGAIRKIPSFLKRYPITKVFLLADVNTWEVAGKSVCEIVKQAGFGVVPYVLKSTKAEPDEYAIGSVAAHMDKTCDGFIGVGSGVINDLGKIVSNLCSLPYMIVGTAPSMDGYASGTSSIIRDNLKCSVNSKVPNIVIGDLDILCKAPLRMIQAGVGDLFAKYISICEWRCSHIINDEYYCGEIASLVNRALQICVDHLDGISKREPDAIAAVMNGMVLSGIAANYAGVTRPVSGMEHYLSHICDMRGEEFGCHTDLHGIQCGVGTVTALRLYEKIRKITPDREKAIAYVKAFNYTDWQEKLRAHIGKGAEAMIYNELNVEHKYDVARHEKRLDRIIARWDDILSIINELPSAQTVSDMLSRIGAPTTFAELGFSEEEEKNAIMMSKDIRDKYVGSRLLWDLGEL